MRPNRVLANKALANKALANRFFAPRRMAGLFLCAFLILGVISAAGGQSGRRPPKRPTSPDPLPPAPSEPPIAQPSTQDKKSGATPILLAKSLYDIVFSSEIYLNAVVEGFMDRIQKTPSVKVQASSKQMNRKEAIDAAKASEDTYVVWFQLRNDSSPAVNSDVRYGQDLYVEYSIFSPSTGKSRTSGHIYQRSTRGVGGAPWPVPNPRTTSPAEYTLRYSGVELAERVLDSLNLLTTPPTH